MRITQAGKKYGWDAPLTLQIVADANALAKAFSEAAPVGAHTHDLPSYPNSKSRTKFPRGGGELSHRLKNWLGRPGNWQPTYTRNKEHEFRGASISIFLAYAQIIDQGGNIPEVHMWQLGRTGKERKSGHMAFRSGGVDHFAKYRRGYSIKGQGYVEKGFANFMASGKYSGGLKVGWRPSTSGE
jgi:hypothetical protein